MSSKKKRKRSCPFSSEKKAPKRKSLKVFNKEWAEALAASDKGSYFEQDKLLELDGPQETEAEESDSEESESQDVERRNRMLCWYSPPATAFETALRADL